jgi:hypothetical protein
MIPEPVSLVPLTIAMLIGIAACAYAGYRAGAGISNFPKGSLPRKVATGLLVMATTVGAVMAGFLYVANTSHDRVYSDGVWSVLAKEYNVYSAVPGEKFKPNVPFPALLGSEQANCTVALPDIILCNGKTVPPADR